jgi:hypothetical protein
MGSRLLFFSGLCFLRGQGRSPLCMGVPSLCRLKSLRCFRTMGVSFLGTDEKGFLDFLTWTENQRYDSDSPPKKDKKLNRKKGKRDVKNLECSMNFDARGVGSSRVRGKKLGF